MILVELGAVEELLCFSSTALEVDHFNGASCDYGIANLHENRDTQVQPQGHLRSRRASAEEYVDFQSFSNDSEVLAGASGCKLLCSGTRSN